MNKIYFFLLVLFVLCGFTGYSVRAQDDNRSVLALYDSPDGDVRETNAHLLLEMPLNRLGLVVEYHNIFDTAYPDPNEYRAVVVWLSDNVSDYGREYFEFLNEAVDSGVRLVLMNGVGITQDSAGNSYERQGEELLKRMGIVQGDTGYLENPFVVDYDEVRKGAFDFEIEEAVTVPVYRDYRINDKMMKAWMTVSRNDVPGAESAVVAVGQRGGFISDIEMVLRYIDEPVWGVLWDLNPFLFLEAAIGIEGSLRPDVTTSFGVRSAFMHIDGDGSSNLTIDLSKKQQLCTEVLKNQILDVYPFPISVSAIGYRLTGEGSLGERFVKALADIMALPQVEGASHTYSHPMNWEEETLGFKIPGYVFSSDMETVGSMEMIREMIMPEGKDVKLLLWSGDCQPTEESLAPLYDVGYYNLNGGNARLDALYQGICHICPLSVKLGKYRQYYAPAGNEYLYTNGWIDNFGGFAKVIDTFENTESPRYLPVDVYYHLYITERRAGLNSLIKVYDWCNEQELCWLRTTEYAAAVTGFMNADTGMDDEGNYYIRDYSGLLTVRLDREERNVDMHKSVNVLGYNHFDGSLYIALLPGEEAKIALTEEEDSGLHLVGSTAAMRGVKVSADTVTGEMRLYSEGFVEFAGVGGEMRFDLGGRKVESEEANKGKFHLPQGAGEWVEFELSVGENYL